jgi:hypothetical protein
MTEWSKNLSFALRCEREIRIAARGNGVNAGSEFVIRLPRITAFGDVLHRPDSC